VKNNNLRKQVLNKARTEQNPSTNRLVNFIEGIDNYKDKKPVKDFLKRNKIYIYSNPKDKLEIVEDYEPIRVEVLRDLIEIYSDSS
jgi:hypothetical protein